MGDRQTCIEYAERAVAGGAIFAEDNPAFAFTTVTLTVADEWRRPPRSSTTPSPRAVRGSVSAYAVASIFRGYLHIFTGDLSEAEADLRNAVEALEQHGLISGMPYALAFLADAQMQRGDLEAAIETLARGRRAPGGLARPGVRLRRPRPAPLPPGRHRDALAEFTRAREVFEELGGINPAVISWRSQMALAHHQLGETEEAKRLAAEEVELAREWGAPRAIAKALRIAGMVEGGEAGIELLREAGPSSRAPRRSSSAPAGLLELGSALRRANRRSRRGRSSARRSSWPTRARRSRSSPRRRRS